RCGSRGTPRTVSGPDAAPGAAGGRTDRLDDGSGCCLRSPAMSTLDRAQQDVIAFLGRPETYGSRCSHVDRIETHISVVFLANDRALKLKRAVQFPYVDYSTLEARRACCEKEVRLNRRTAPGLYRGVVAVTRSAA